MKYFQSIYTIILSMLMMCGCSNEKFYQDPTDTTSYNIKGNIKSLTSTTFYTEMEYGEFIKGEILSKDSLNYDGKHNLLSSYYRSGYHEHYTKNEYQNNQKVSSTLFDEDQDIYAKIHYEYSESELVCKETRYERNNEISFCTETEYNTDGNIIGIECRSKDSHGDYSYSAIYASKQIKSEFKTSHEKIKNTMKFDKNGYIKYQSGINIKGIDTIFFESHYEYYKNKDVKLIKSYDKFPNSEIQYIVRSFTYTYDDFGNWTNRVELINILDKKQIEDPKQRNCHITEREITYFE